MDKAKVEEIAKQLGLEPELVWSWSARFRKMNPWGGGRPRGRLRRPAGWIAVGDAKAKYEVDGDTLRVWRASGLPFKKTRGNMILMNEPALRVYVDRSRK